MQELRCSRYYIDMTARVLFTILILSLFSFSVFAQTPRRVAQTKVEEEKPQEVDFIPTGEYRLRYRKFENPSGVDGANDEIANFEARGLIDFKVQKGERIYSKARLLYTGVLGQSQDPQQTTDAFLVNLFYGWWKPNDSLNIYFGRFEINISDEKFFAANPYEQVPYVFDGTRFAFETDFAFFDLYLVKLAELKQGTVAGFLTNDPESNLYIINGDLKDLPENLTRFNFHFAQFVRDETIDNGVFPTSPKVNLQHLSIGFKGFIGIFNFDVALAKQFGKQKGKIDASTNFEQNFEGSLMDIEFSIPLPDLYNFNFWLGFHKDSGGQDSQLLGQNVSTYQSLYYNLHENAGRMDVLRWGNLMYYRVGFQFSFYDSSLLGFEYLNFSKSNPGGAVTLGSNYNLALGSALKADEGDLGSEFDLWFDQDYDYGFNSRIRLSAFLPGAALKEASTPAENVIFQVFASMLVKF